jgi:hypothetical protein
MPVIGISNPGNTSGCAPYTLSFMLNFRSTSGSVHIPNLPGTLYRVTSNDPGFADSVFYQPSVGMPDSIFTHTFTENSCGYNASSSLQNGFEVEVMARNQCAAAFSKIYPIHINEAAHASFTSVSDSVICAGTTMSFDGSDSTGVSISISSPNSGCSQSLNRYWEISPMTGVVVNTQHPSGGFFPALGIAPGASPNTRGVEDISVRFDAAGTYSIKYFLGNYCGLDSFEKIICVVPQPNATFQLSSRFLCNPDTVFLSNTSSSIPSCDSSFYSWGISLLANNCTPSLPNWAFVNGTSNTSINPAINFTSPGLYAVTLYDSGFCGIDSITVVDTVARQPENYFNITPDTLCANSPLTINTIIVRNCYDPTATYQWTYTGGTIQFPNQENPGNLSTDSAGLFFVSLTVTNRCSDTTFHDTIRILANPILTFSSPVELCVDGDTFTLSSASPSGGTYSSLANARRNGRPFKVKDVIRRRVFVEYRVK